LHFSSAIAAAAQKKKRKFERASGSQRDHVTPGESRLPEEQHKATDKRAEIVLAINFGRRAERNRSKHLSSWA